MSVSLNIYGHTYDGVEGIKAKDTNNDTRVFVLTEDATISSGNQLLSGVTAFGAAGKYTGTIPTKSQTDLTVSGATVTVPAGYYSAQTSKSVATGTAGTPTATKGTVSNHSVSVTPSVTNTTGYITGGTKTGTAVTVSASELVSGNKAISANGTGIDVANYATVSVAVPGDTPSLQEKTNIAPSTSSQTITPDDGYDGLSSIQINAMPSGSATTPATTVTANPSISVNSTTGLITATASATKSVTPTVSAGYVSSGTAGTITVSGSNTSQLTVQAAKTVTPTETAQTAVAAGRYTTGAVKVAAIPSDYVGSGITTRSSTDLTASGATVTAPAGYYEESASKSIDTATLDSPVTLTSTPRLTVNSETGLITASIPNSETSSLIVKTAGYISKEDRLAIKVSGSNTSQLTVQAAKTVTPTEETQTAVVAGRYTTGAVTVAAIPSDYVGSGITTRSSTDLTASGATVTVPAGYYEEQATKSVASGSATTPATTVTANPSISVNSTTGLITATSSATKSVTPTVSAGYVSAGTAGTITVSGSNTSQLTVQAAKTVTPTKSSQTAVAAGRYTTGAVTVAAIPAEYITTSDATAAASDITYGKTAYVNGSKITGTDRTYVINLFKINNLWTPSCSISDIVDANAAGMVLMLLIDGSTSITGSVVSVTSNTLWYTIVENNTSTVTVYDYYYNSSGAHIDYSQILYRTTDATASSSDVANGKTFYNSSGKVTGTLSLVTYYTGSSAPSASTGSNGDIYLKTS